MFQNEFYSHELASLPAPVQKDVGTLVYFSLHLGDDATTLAHFTPYWSYTTVAFVQQPSIQTISYLVNVTEIRQSFELAVEVDIVYISFIFLIVNCNEKSNSKNWSIVEDSIVGGGEID